MLSAIASVLSISIPYVVDGRKGSALRIGDTGKSSPGSSGSDEKAETVFSGKPGVRA